MSEHEKTIRDTAERVWGKDAPSTKAVLTALNALLAEHRAEVDAWKNASGLEVTGDPDGVTPEMLRKDLARRENEASSTRDAALEEAARHIDAGVLSEMDRRTEAVRIRALKYRPADRYLPEAEVRDALLASRQRARGEQETVEVAILARRLGVDLDAAQEDTPATPDRHRQALGSYPVHGAITIAGRTYPPEQVYNEPALDACECGGRSSRCRRCDGTGLYRASQDE